MAQRSSRQFFSEEFMKRWSAGNIASHRADELHVENDICCDGSSCPVISVDTLEALIQAVGYLSYISDGPVLYRGQSNLYSPYIPRPSLCRNSVSSDSRLETVENYLSVSGCWNNDVFDIPESKPILSSEKPITNHSAIALKLEAYCVEPLLQHYGIQTRWLDLTDSLCHALFFSVVKDDPIDIDDLPNAGSSVDVNFLNKHILNRSVYLPLNCEEKNYCYLYVLSVGKENHSSSSKLPKGIRRCANGWILDGRKAFPSTYLRPHSQHSFMLFAPSLVNEEAIDLFNSDYDSINCALFRMKTNDVLDWIGSGRLLSPMAVYPVLKSVSGYLGDSGFYQWVMNIESQYSCSGTIKTLDFSRGKTFDDFMNLIGENLINYVPVMGQR